MTLPHDEWREMRESDLDTVAAISDAVHKDYTESRETYAERISLYPQGCKVFTRNGETAGYIVSHPWKAETPPALNEVLGALPEDADSYYFHDIALLPEARGSGAGRQAVEIVTQQALQAGFKDVTLVAINGADSYWKSQGFTVVEGRKSYGDGTFAMTKSVA